MSLRSPQWLIVAATSGLVANLSAVEVVDLAGDWVLARLDSPVALRETYYNTVTEEGRTSVDSSDYAKQDEVLVNCFYPDALTTDFRSISISGTGAVSGDETGQILSVSMNRIFYTDGAEETTVFSNMTGDTMLTSSRNADLQDQTFLLKRPDALVATSQLEGDWTVLSMINRADIQKNIDSGTGRLADTWYVAEPSNAAGDVTIANDGSFTGLFDGTVATSGTTPGDMTVTVDAESIPFKHNASGTLAIGTPGDADEQEIVLLMRKPATLALADMAGTWRISAMTIPTTLTEGYTQTESPFAGSSADNSQSAPPGYILTDIYHTDPFELGRFQVLVDATGGFTGSVTGSMVLNGDDAVSVTVDGETFPLYVNSDKTIMAGIRTYADSHELIFGLKYCDNCATSFEGEVDMQPVVDESTGRIIYSWNNGDNIQLQSSTTLGGWSAVEGAGGADTHAVTPTGTRFFQVTEAP
ncbi:MAG: hypothetical protein ACO3SO_05290 [Luteolibacter sp.]